MLGSREIQELKAATDLRDTLKVPLTNKKGLNIDPINPEIFELLPYVHFFKDFPYKTFREFLCFSIALTRSIFELEKCSFF